VMMTDELWCLSYRSQRTHSLTSVAAAVFARCMITTLIIIIIIVITIIIIIIIRCLLAYVLARPDGPLLKSRGKPARPPTQIARAIELTEVTVHCCVLRCAAL
jgi:hypothetical protein